MQKVHLKSCYGIVQFFVVFSICGAAWWSAPVQAAVSLRAETVAAGESAAAVHLYLAYDNETPGTVVFAGAWPATLTENTADTLQVALADSHHQAGFLMDWAFYPAIDGDAGTQCLAVAVFPSQAGTPALAPGELLRFTLQFSAAGQEALSIPITPAAPDNAPRVNGRALYSSVASLQGQPLAFVQERIIIPVKCAPPEAPRRVRTRVFNWENIALRWSAPDHPTPLTYGVYRARVRDAAQAVLLTPDFIPDLSYLDATAAAPESAAPGGCSCASPAFYYWVRARDAETGCVSALSKPAKGVALKPCFIRERDEDEE